MAFVNPASAVIVGAVDSHHLLGLYLLAGLADAGAMAGVEQALVPEAVTALQGQERRGHRLKISDVGGAMVVVIGQPVEDSHQGGHHPRTE